MHGWSHPDVADALIGGLAAAGRELDREQSVTGLDARREIELHPVLAAGLGASGFGVERERRYPVARGARRRSEGHRCDLVVLPDGRSLRAEPGAATLFEPQDAVEPDDALWLEVKTVAQFRAGDPDPAWSARLGASVRQDVRKLAEATDVRHAAMALVVFAGSADVALHDLRVWLHVALDHELPVGTPVLRQIPISDRHGNSVVVLALHPIGRL